MDVYRRLVNRDLPREERACTSKVQFVTRDEARSYLRSGHLTAGSALEVYRCDFGDHWHLGHRRRRHARSDPDGAAASRLRCQRAAEPPRRADDGPAWLGREWWADRGRRHLRPGASDRSWREAWGAAT